MEGVLSAYFKSVTPEQFKKDWEAAVGHLPKNVGPTVQELFESWNEFYGVEIRPNEIQNENINNGALETFQGLCF